MEPPIFTVAASDPEVIRLLGSSPVRLWPFGEAPQNAAYPYAVWQVINGTPENYLAQRPDMDGLSLQVDVYGKSAGEVRAVVAALRRSLELSTHITRIGRESKDSPTNTYRSGFDLHWLHSR